MATMPAEGHEPKHRQAPRLPWTASREPGSPLGRAEDSNTRTSARDLLRLPSWCSGSQYSALDIRPRKLEQDAVVKSVWGGKGRI